MKTSGKIGYGFYEESSPGVISERIEEKKYRGDTIDFNTNINSNDVINDNLVLNNKISIVLDPFIRKNYQKIKYITYTDIKWKVKSITIKYPRIILTLGDIYNE